MNKAKQFAKDAEKSVDASTLQVCHTEQFIVSFSLPIFCVWIWPGHAETHDQSPRGGDEMSQVYSEVRLCV